MALTVTILRGLPGSGKSTWAKQAVIDSNCSVVRVSKDDLRSMLHAGKYSKGNEKMVLEVRNDIIMTALRDGKHVIVDDTNFEPKHENEITALVAAFCAAHDTHVMVEVKVFDTPIDECIARDIKRANGVGEKVIRSMYNKYLKPKSPEWVPAKQDPSLPHCIIVDIDGTLAKMKDRGPFEWDKVGQDEAHEDIINAMYSLKQSGLAILTSGRDESCRPETEKWLSDNGIGFWKLFMRPAGNMEKDSIIKERLYREHIEGKYYVAFVLDDRNQVVEMWRSLGLRCLQVADGDF